MSTFRQVVDRLERVVAVAVADAVDTPVIADAVLDAGKLGAAGLRRIDDLRSTAVHLLSLPSHRDVRALAAEIARLQTALAEVQAQLEDVRLAAVPTVALERGP
jgi:hypothetical protein